MNDEQIKQKLKEEIVATQKQIELYVKNTAPIAPDDAIGRVSRMDAINNKSVSEASLGQAKAKLKSLNRVLANVGTEDFGICIKCKNSIPLGRIMIRPQSLLCVKCAE